MIMFRNWCVILSFHLVNVTAIISPLKREYPGQSACPTTRNVCPSKQNFRVYEYFKLPNGLRILLIEDKSDSSITSSAVMSVDTGSWDDSLSYLGLAHLLEHVLIEGKESKDEDPFLYDVVMRGGAAWGITSEQETKYSFEIPTKDLLHTLERFSRVFTNALLDPAFITEEVNAVHMEYEKNLHRFGSKYWQLIKHVSNREHPFYKFDTGNVHTLYLDDTPQKVIDLYYQRYSAEIMNLVVYSSHQNPNLKDNITEMFSYIPTTNAVPHYYKDLFPFDGHVGRIVIMKCDTCLPTLTMLWQTPSVRSNPRSAVEKFLTQYLEQKGEGSLYNYFIMCNLASSLKVRFMVHSFYFDLLQISIELTTKGLQNSVLVVKLVFQFLNVIKKAKTVEFKNLWKEFIEKQTILFDWKREDMSEYIDSLSSRMRIYKNPFYFIDNPYNYLANFSEIKHVLGILTPQKLLVVLSTSKVVVSPRLNVSEDFQNVQSDVEDYGNYSIPIPELNFLEPYYGTPFAIYATPETFMQIWSTTELYHGLFLPSPSKFIPNPLSLSIHRTKQFSKLPEVYYTTPLVRTWVLSRTSFSPIVNVRCILRRKNTATTVRQWALTMAYMELVGEILRVQWYSAEVMSYKISFRYNPRSILFDLDGFGDDDVIKRLIKISFYTLINDENILKDSTLFTRVMRYIIKDYQNYYYAKSSMDYVYQHLRKELLWRPHWSYEQILNEMYGLKLEDVLNFGTLYLLKDTNLECLFGGYTEKTQTHMIVSEILTILDPYMNEKALIQKVYSYKQVRLRKGKTYGLAIQNTDSNSVVLVMFQTDRLCTVIAGAACTIYTIQNKVLLYILNLIMKAACSNHLHMTKNYLAECIVDFDGSIGSFTVIIQSEKETPNQLLLSIDNFLHEYFNHVSMSESFHHQFHNVKQGLDEALFSDYLTVDETWNQIISGKNQFNIRNQEHEVLKGLTLEVFRAFYNETLLDQTTWRKLTVVMYGKGKSVYLDVDCYIQYDKIDQGKGNLESTCE